MTGRVLRAVDGKWQKPKTVMPADARKSMKSEIASARRNLRVAEIENRHSPAEARMLLESKTAPAGLHSDGGETLQQEMHGGN